MKHLPCETPTRWTIDIYFKLFERLIFLFMIFLRIASKPAGHMSFYDPAEIHNRNALKKYSQESIVKLVYHIIGFFVFLYR